MPTTANYLSKLVSQKNTLADNLVTKGVAATHDETLETLVPKVLKITGGQAITPESLGYVSDAVMFFDGEYNWGNRHGNNGLVWLNMCYDEIMIRESGTIGEKYCVKKSNSTNIFKTVSSVGYDSFTAEIVCDITAINTTTENNLFSNFSDSGFGIYITNNKMNASMYDTNSYKGVSFGDVVMNQVQTISMTYDGNTMKAFLNGALIGEKSIASYIKSSTVFGIGGSGTGKYFNYEMNIYRFSMYNRALTDGEIAQNYNADVTRFI